MECYTCSVSSVCKVFEMANSMKMLVNINVSNCSIRSGAPSIAVPPAVEQKEVVYQRSYDQISSISDKIKSMQQANVNDSDETVLCPDCNTKTPSASMVVCDKCKATMCEGCCVVNPGDNKAYCETCWDEI